MDFERFIEGLVKAGFDGDPSDYDKLDPDNRLKGREIKRLLFGKKATGYHISGLQWSVYRSAEGDLEYEFPVGSTAHKGKTWIEGDSVCNQYEDLYDGLKHCSDIYSNPKGDDILLSEYLDSAGYWIFPFSIMD